MNHAPSVALAEATVLLTDGTHYTPPDIGTGIPFLTVKDVSDRGLDFIHSAKISEQEFARARAQNSAPEFGDVLFSKDGTVGKVHLVTEVQPFAVLSSLAILRPSKNLHSGYLAHFLRTPAAIEAAERRKTGSAIRRIVLRDLAALTIPLPPLDEQRRIAAILDKADALRQKRKRAIALLDSLTQAIFFQMFEANGSALRPIGEVATVLNGAGFPLDEQGQTTGTIPFYKVSDMNLPGNEIAMRQANNYVSRESAERLGASVHPAGSVIFPKIGAAIATNKKRVLTVPSAFDNNVIGLLADEKHVIGPYVFALMQSVDLSTLAQPGNPPSIRKSTIEAFEVPVPNMGLQQRFADRIREVEGQIAISANNAALLETLFASLQHRAFSGQL